jgi:hypothetical protein
MYIQWDLSSATRSKCQLGSITFFHQQRSLPCFKQLRQHQQPPTTTYNHSPCTPLLI